MRDGIRLPAEATPDELGTSDDVAPLVAGAGLQFHSMRLIEVSEVVGLQQHVAELGVRDAVLALDTAAHRVFRHHLIDREVFPYIA